MGFIVGLSLGIWTALYQGHLRAYRPHRGLLIALDVLFALGALVVSAVGLYFTDWLSLRVYALFAMAVGVLTALYLAGPAFRALSFVLTRGALAVLWVLAWPVRRLQAAWRASIGRRPPRGGNGPQPPVPPVSGGVQGPSGHPAMPRPWWIPGG